MKGLRVGEKMDRQHNFVFSNAWALARVCTRAGLEPVQEEVWQGAQWLLRGPRLAGLLLRMAAEMYEYVVAM
jgi:hypothetical protein